MAYTPSPTLVHLHFRKAAYQHTMLVAWSVVVTMAAIAAALLLNRHPSPLLTVIAPVTLGSAPAGGGGAPGYPGQPGREHGFHGLVSAPIRILRDGAPDRPSVEPPDVFGSNLLPAMQMVSAAGPPLLDGASGPGGGNGGAGLGGDDFGLPGQPLYARTIGSASWPGPTRASMVKDEGSPAVIEWVTPRYPKVGLNSKVLCLVDLTADGRKTIEVLYTETWNQFDGRRSEVQFFTGPDKWGYARAVVSALMESIFWPATDSDGRELPGQFLIDCTFCMTCPPESWNVRVVSGDVVVRDDRSR